MVYSNLAKSNSQPTKKIDYSSRLNSQQYRVVTQAEGPCLVLAGAGSGKTRTLVYRVAYLLEAGVQSDKILLVTFTKKAAKEMISRVEQLLGKTEKSLWAGTFHHIGNRLLRRYGKAVKLNHNFTILDKEDSKDLLKSILATQAPKDKRFPKADLMSKIISLSANTLKPIDQTVATFFLNIEENHIPIIEDIAKAYKNKKIQGNLVDFDDLLLKWYELLIHHPPIKNKLSQQFEYILVDEYQDTNFLQGQIIKRLSGQSQNILVVGDDSQSIYSFRGAEIKNILNFQKHFKNSQLFKLETNYRSSHEILALANYSILNNQAQFNKKLKSVRGAGAKPMLAALADAEEQASFIAQRILELENEEGVDLSQIAILFRSHFHCLELELELNKRNIPYEMRGGLRFFEQAHIKDVLAYLKILANPNDELAWQRVLLKEDQVGPASLRKIWSQIDSLSDLSQLAQMPVAGLTSHAMRGWQKTTQRILSLLKLDKNSISQIIDYIIQAGYEDYLKAVFDNYQERLEDLRQLSNFSGRYGSLNQFLSDILLSENFKAQRFTSSLDTHQLSVTLSTIHQAKGLEWRVVFMISLLEGYFPHAKVFDDPQKLEEERRLFYVATTRAKDNLYLTHPQFARNLSQPSRFIQELPEDSYTLCQLDSYPDEDIIEIPF